MSRPAIPVALLACAAIGACGEIHAQPRGPLTRDVREGAQQAERPAAVLDEAARATRIAELEAWLQRLVGQFRSEGKVTLPDAVYAFQSTANCTHIDDGPGVRCFVGEWVPAPSTRSEYNSNLGALPLMYFGIRPDTLDIQLVLVDYSLVGGRSGTLVGDTVDFSVDNWEVCHTSPFGSCWAVAEITATPDGSIFMKFAVDHWSLGRLPVRTRDGHSSLMELQLHRTRAADAGTTGTARPDTDSTPGAPARQMRENQSAR